MLSLIRHGFLHNHTHKKVVILKILANIIITVTLVSVWQSIYQTNDLGLSIDYLINYTIISSGLATIYTTNVIGVVSNQVKSGNIIFSVSKPKGIFYQLFFESIGISIFKFIYIVIPSYLVLFSIYYPHLEILSILQFILIFSVSYILMFLFDFIFGLISIYSLNSWGLQSFKYALITIFAGSIIPIDLYPKTLRNLVEVLPFSKLYAVPINTILIGNNINLEIVLEYIITIGLFALFA